MRGYVATTDFSWFTFLRARQPLDEVNFWQPSAHGFNAKAGTPFFFKLKAPHYAIGGFGIFARYEEASPALAWEAFGAKNGAASFDEMRKRVEGYASKPSNSAPGSVSPRRAPCRRKTRRPGVSRARPAGHQSAPGCGFGRFTS